MSTATISPVSDLTITFQGPGEFAELVGGEQGNFLVRRGDAAGREVAVVLNHQASAALAKELGVEDTEEFRLGAVRIVGRRAIERLIETSNRIDGLITVSAASLREDPELVTAARIAMPAPPPPPAAPEPEAAHEEAAHTPEPVAAH